MSRFMTIDNLPPYMHRLKSIVYSLLCNHTSMKCIEIDSSFEFYSCPIRLIEELDIRHAYHSLIMETLRTFHHKYGGCSCKTLLFFLTTFYSHLQTLLDKNNRLIQKKIFDYLEQYIERSISIARSNFLENLRFDSNTFHRVCRLQDIYSDSLYQAYVHFSSLNSSHQEIVESFNKLNLITRVKYSEGKCLFIPGTILPTDRAILGSKRTILIDGYILEDYVHLGYNNKLKIKQTSTKSSWTYLILSILKQYSIDVILCSGTVDERLKESQCIFIEYIPTSIFRLFEHKHTINYITDINEETILLLNYHGHVNDSSLVFIEYGSTIIQYVSFKGLIDVKHEQFMHCLARFRNILKENFYLKGSGEFEKCLYKYWYDKNENTSIENNLAYECFLECLQLFVNELYNRKDTYETDLIDDFESKFDAWKTSIHLLRVLMQIDSVIKIFENDDRSDI